MRARRSRAQPVVRYQTSLSSRQFLRAGGRNRTMPACSISSTGRRHTMGRLTMRLQTATLEHVPP